MCDEGNEASDAERCMRMTGDFLNDLRAYLVVADFLNIVN